MISLDPGRLLKKGYHTCKPLTESTQRAWCGATRKLLFELNLGHLWSSELTGNTKQWSRLIYDCINARELAVWKANLQQKSKLRLYLTIKSTLAKEEYLLLPLALRSHIAEMRCGTNRLRIETGCWEKEAVAERFCRVCVWTCRG